MGDVVVKEEEGEFKIYDDGICYDVCKTNEEAQHAASLLRDSKLFDQEARKAVDELLLKRTEEQRKFIRELNMGKIELEV